MAVEYPEAAGPGGGAAQLGTRAPMHRLQACLHQNKNVIKKI
jgi:hypothetical protein